MFIRPRGEIQSQTPLATPVATSGLISKRKGTASCAVGLVEDLYAPSLLIHLNDAVTRVISH